MSLQAPGALVPDPDRLSVLGGSACALTACINGSVQPAPCSCLGRSAPKPATDCPPSASSRRGPTHSAPPPTKPALPWLQQRQEATPVPHLRNPQRSVPHSNPLSRAGSHSVCGPVPQAVLRFLLSVHVPVTSVPNQGQFPQIFNGFCWATSDILMIRYGDVRAALLPDPNASHPYGQTAHLLTPAREMPSLRYL